MGARTPFAHPARRWAVLTLFAAVVGVLVWRAVDLQLLRRNFLQDHGDARYLRVVQIPAHRGLITDRNGAPLAVSTPVDSVWAVPRKLWIARKRWPELERMLGLGRGELKTLLQTRMNRDFVYIKRLVDPSVAEAVKRADFPGVFLKQEYRRYYPTGEVAAHIIGFTNVDDVGQEGIELAFNSWLRGVPGEKRVIKDRLGRIVENVDSIRAPRPGRDLTLSIDRRIQYVAYRDLKAAVLRHRAKSGSIVVLNARTGEVLAMANQPSYNPNNRSELRSDYYRNRAVTDVFEPGSTIKPFTIAAALESGRYTPSTEIDTSPGYYTLSRYTIRDVSDYGRIDVSHVIIKSSNVGASKIALSLNPQRLWQMYHDVGFGEITDSGFPGEAAGRLNNWHNWRDVDQAAISYGYGISVTDLQLAQAYTVFANSGRLIPVSLQKLSGPPPKGRQVMSPKVAHEVLKMLEGVVTEGTGQNAQIPGYLVGGKTGTVHKSTLGGYSKDRYVSVFVGLLPVTDPQLIAAVMINEPSGRMYYGGQVAAPVFEKVMANAARLLDIPPDDLKTIGNTTLADAGEMRLARQGAAQ